MNEFILAIIPARGGSKRIKKKNIRNFHGRPMINWPIEQIKKCNIVNDIIVSTDDGAIKDIAESAGVSVPFMRPANLSDDYTETSYVIKHALEWYIENVRTPDYVLTVYPTSVFIKSDDVNNAFKILKSNKNEMIFSGMEYSFPIQRAIFINENSRIEMFQPENYAKRSQDLVRAYHDAGQFYLAKTRSVLSLTSSFSKDSSMFLLKRDNAVDIDTEEDLEFAEKLFKLKFTQ